jgi:hypothetical protein
MTSKTKIAEYKRPMSELIRTAKALDAKIKQQQQKTEQLQVTLGLTLREAKERKPNGITWPAFVAKHFNFSRSRADELIQIADGRTTVEEVRAKDAAKKREWRANPPGRPGGSVRFEVTYEDRKIAVPVYVKSEVPEPTVVRPVYVGEDADDAPPMHLVASATQPEPMPPLDVSSLVALAQIERAVSELALAIERGDIRKDIKFERRVKAVADRLLALVDDEHAAAIN